MQPEILHLIERWRNGDERAAEALYNTYRTDMLRLAWSIVQDGEAAEEIMQDAMTYALMNIHNYDENKSAFKTWLFTITVSRSRDFLRKKRPLLVNLADWLELGHQPEDQNHEKPESSAVRGETSQELWSAMQELPQKQREALILRFWGDCTYHEMSEILDAPLPTIQSRVRFGYQKLRKLFHPEWLEDVEEQLL